VACSQRHQIMVVFNQPKGTRIHYHRVAHNVEDSVAHCKIVFILYCDPLLITSLNVLFFFGRFIFLVHNDCVINCESAYYSGSRYQKYFVHIKCGVTLEPSAEIIRELNGDVDYLNHESKDLNNIQAFLCP
jgi:hypothetical protein